MRVATRGCFLARRTFRMVFPKEGEDAVNVHTRSQPNHNRTRNAAAELRAHKYRSEICTALIQLLVLHLIVRQALIFCKGGKQKGTTSETPPKSAPEGRPPGEALPAGATPPAAPAAPPQAPAPPTPAPPAPAPPAAGPPPPAAAPVPPPAPAGDNNYEDLHVGDNPPPPPPP
ncbi:hypothetical protein RB195_012476 [Necator americanus]|uniref:Uncharacterized protein n=1 Tax=Necator americanus TaxID=51031 RepID=A0ABR1D794_NECAM